VLAVGHAFEGQIACSSAEKLPPGGGVTQY
jgi:hypothetical protein